MTITARRALWGLLAHNKRHLTLAIASSVLNKLCDIAPELLIGLSIDIIINRTQSAAARLTGIESPLTLLYLLGGLTALLWILESVFEYCYQRLWRRIGHEAQHALRVRTYAHLQSLSLAYFESKSSGELLSIISDDINELEEFLSRGVSEIIQLAVNIVVMGGLFFLLSPTLAVLTIAPVPVVLAVAYFFQRRLAVLYEALRTQVAALSSHLAGRLVGITTIKAYGAEAREVASLAAESGAYRAASEQAGRFNAAYIPVVRMGILCGFIMSLIVGGKLALAGGLGVSFYSVLVFLTQRFLWPFTTLTSITDLYERALASMRRVCGLLGEARTTMQQARDEGQLVAGGADICFEHVSFSYPNGKQVFAGLSLRIPARKTVAFVGSTGSGKSTIIKLLLRLYDPTTGSITLGGNDLGRLDVAALRRAIGLVSQEVYLIDGTVAENIAYGRPEASHEEIVAAAQAAEAHEFIMQLPAGYESHVGENGKNLSGGQRQRIAIARAVLKQPEIFIFDEATSALDNETEAAVQRSIASLAQDHTMIIVAHRLSIVRRADLIFVLEQGRIVESGSHDELLAAGGNYAALWKIQTGG